MFLPLRFRSFLMALRPVENTHRLGPQSLWVDGICLEREGISGAGRSRVRNNDLVCIQLFAVYTAPECDSSHTMFCVETGRELMAPGSWGDRLCRVDIGAGGVGTCFRGLCPMQVSVSPPCSLSQAVPAWHSCWDAVLWPLLAWMTSLRSSLVPPVFMGGICDPQPGLYRDALDT